MRLPFRQELVAINQSERREIFSDEYTTALFIAKLRESNCENP